MSVVDDQYWLNYGQKTIENTVISINEAAGKLEKMILWFWGLYTASFTIGVTINVISAPTPVLILLASPIASLILTYWSCNWVQLPVISRYDPQIPEEVKNSFNRAARIKNSRLKKTLFLTFFSAVLLSFALFSLAFVKKKEKFQVDFAHDKELNKIIISGLFPKETIIHVGADSLNNSSLPVTFFSTYVKVLDNENLNCNIPIDSIRSPINVKLYWKDEGGLFSLITKKIELQK